MSLYEILRHFADSYGLVVIFQPLFGAVRMASSYPRSRDRRRASQALDFQGRRSWLIKHGIDEPTGTEFVGHEWDGIEELDTPHAALVAVDVLRHHRLVGCLCRALPRMAIAGQPSH